MNRERHEQKYIHLNFNTFLWMVKIIKFLIFFVPFYIFQIPHNERGSIIFFKSFLFLQLDVWVYFKKSILFLLGNRGGVELGWVQTLESSICSWMKAQNCLNSSNKAYQFTVNNLGLKTTNKLTYNLSITDKNITK